jgi:hypothetical protein
VDFWYAPCKFSLTLADANIVADAIASNINIRMFGLLDFSKLGIFCEEGTFECILNAVLEAGVHILPIMMVL